MYPNERRLTLLIRALLQRVGMEYLWTEEGPTDQALELPSLRGREGPDPRRLGDLERGRGPRTRRRHEP